MAWKQKNPGEKKGDLQKRDLQKKGEGNGGSTMGQKY